LFASDKKLSFGKFTIGIRDQGSGIRDQRSEIRDQRLEIRNLEF
jgi:anti-sigma regulatory factor (Ser/Thr protein kinase)